MFPDIAKWNMRITRENWILTKYLASPHALCFRFYFPFFVCTSNSHDNPVNNEVQFGKRNCVYDLRRSPLHVEASLKFGAHSCHGRCRKQRCDRDGYSVTLTSMGQPPLATVNWKWNRPHSAKWIAPIEKSEFQSSLRTQKAREASGLISYSQGHSLPNFIVYNEWLSVCWCGCHKNRLSLRVLQFSSCFLCASFDSWLWRKPIYSHTVTRNRRFNTILHDCRQISTNKLNSIFSHRLPHTKHTKWFVPQVKLLLNE